MDRLKQTTRSRGGTLVQLSNDSRQWEYKGKPLSSLKDFEVAFKPTKWSINSIKDYCESMSLEESVLFIQYAKKTLNSKNAARSKGLDLFIEKVSSYGNRLQTTLYAKKEYLTPLPIHRIKVQRNQKELLDLLINHFNTGTFDSSANNLSKVLSQCFDFGLHPTTIRDKFYKSRKK